MDDLAPDERPPAPATTFCGARWAVILGATLLVTLAFVTAARWFGSPAASAEQIVQIPVPAATATPLPPPELFAPDPGDTP